MWYSVATPLLASLFQIVTTGIMFSDVVSDQQKLVLVL